MAGYVVAHMGLKPDLFTVPGRAPLSSSSSTSSSEWQAAVARALPLAVLVVRQSAPRATHQRAAADEFANSASSRYEWGR